MLLASDILDRDGPVGSSVPGVWVPVWPPFFLSLASFSSVPWALLHLTDNRDRDNHHNHQVYSCQREASLSIMAMCAQLRTFLKLLKPHSTIVLRWVLNWVPIILRDASLSDSRCKFFQYDLTTYTFFYLGNVLLYIAGLLWFYCPSNNVLLYLHCDAMCRNGGITAGENYPRQHKRCSSIKNVQMDLHQNLIWICHKHYSCVVINVSEPDSETLT